MSLDLGVSYIDQVLLSVQSLKDVENFSATFIPLYQTLEELHDQERITGIGVSDLDKDKMEVLYNAAKVYHRVVLL